MHEFGLCEGVVDAVRQRAGGRRVTGGRVRFGVRHAVDEESLAQAFSMIAEGTEAAGAAVELVTVAATIDCPDCGHSGEAKITLATCPRCARGTRGPQRAGPLMSVRYAYPPNALGYCGPADFAAFREYAVAGVVDRGLVQLAQAFAGAWPYLELIASGCGIGDPLDRRVVEAYWVGNDLLDKVPVTEIGDSMQA